MEAHLKRFSGIQDYEDQALRLDWRGSVRLLEQLPCGGQPASKGKCGYRNFRCTLFGIFFGQDNGWLVVFRFNDDALEASASQVRGLQTFRQKWDSCLSTMMSTCMLELRQNVEAACSFKLLPAYKCFLFFFGFGHAVCILPLGLMTPRAAKVDYLLVAYGYFPKS